MQTLRTLGYRKKGGRRIELWRRERERRREADERTKNKDMLQRDGHTCESDGRGEKGLEGESRAESAKGRTIE